MFLLMHNTVQSSCVELRSAVIWHIGILKNVSGGFCDPKIWKCFVSPKLNRGHLREL